MSILPRPSAPLHVPQPVRRAQEEPSTLPGDIPAEGSRPYPIPATGDDDRAAPDFDRAMEQLERDNPVPAASPDSFPFHLG